MEDQSNAPELTAGHKLYVTVNYAFNYDFSPFVHAYQFDIITQFFEKRLGLEGFVKAEDGEEGEEYIKDASALGIFVKNLFDAFDDHDVPGFVERMLEDNDMWEVLAEYKAPLEGDALKYKEELMEAYGM